MIYVVFIVEYIRHLMIELKNQIFAYINEGQCTLVDDTKINELN
jgi:hypothetical protein